MSKTQNRVRPETSNNFLCVEVGERATLSDYKTIFLPAVTDIMSKHGTLQVALVYGDDFLGWDIDAAAFDLEQMSKMGQHVKKVALINPPEVVVYRWQTLKPLLGGEVRIYEGDCLEEAITWAKA